MLTIDPTCPAGGTETPYRTRFFDDVMPLATWQTLVDTFPDDHDLRELNAVGLKNHLTDAHEAFGARLASRPEWASLFGWIRTNFSQLCADVLDIPLDGKHVRIEWSSLPGAGGQVLPHPDTAKKIATAVMYFGGAWCPAWGGAFEVLRHRTDPDGDWTDRRCPFDEVDTVLAVPMQPARMLFMQRTNNSLHGVRPVCAPMSRRSVTINLMGRRQP